MRKRRLGTRGRRTDRTPSLVLLPVFLAPLVLVGGWNLAASAQTDDYSNVQNSLSSLAGLSTPHRGIMTWTFLLLGLAHLGTAALLRAAAPLGRAVHALGGLATIAVAFLPLSDENDGTGHAIVATVAFVSLAVWPALGARTGADVAPVLHPRPMRAATVVLSVLVVVFAVSLLVGNLVGLTERVAATAQALWPLVVAWLVREWGGGGTPTMEDPPELEPDDETPQEDPQDGEPDPADDPVTTASS